MRAVLPEDAFLRFGVLLAIGDQVVRFSQKLLHLD